MSDQLRQAAQMALEALKTCGEDAWPKVPKAIYALQAALEQQQVEPAQDPKYMVQSNGRHSPLLSHMMNKRIALEQQQAKQAALKSTYHPCTSILIQGLKKLKSWDVLAEWDRERGIVDERLNTATKQQQVEPVTYPAGNIVGACICGSWPGGKCLKCPVQ